LLLSESFLSEAENNNIFKGSRFAKEFLSISYQLILLVSCLQ